MADASAKKSKLVQIHIFIQYNKGFCQVHGRTLEVLWGVGVQATLHIKRGEKYLTANRLSTLAAAVELNKAQVTFALTTLGITGTAVRDVLPDAGAFNVQNYAEMITAVDRIRRMLEEPSVKVVPQLILPRHTLALIDFNA